MSINADRSVNVTGSAPKQHNRACVHLVMVVTGPSGVGEGARAEGVVWCQKRGEQCVHERSSQGRCVGRLTPVFNRIQHVSCCDREESVFPGTKGFEPPTTVQLSGASCQASGSDNRIVKGRHRLGRALNKPLAGGDGPLRICGDARPVMAEGGVESPGHVPCRAVLCFEGATCGVVLLVPGFRTP